MPEDTTEETLKIILHELQAIKTDNQEFKSNIFSKLDNINVEISTIKETQAELAKSCNYNSNEYEKHRLQQNKILTIHANMEQSMTALETENLELKKSLESCQNAVNHLENRNRLHNVEITGIPLQEHENCMDIVQKIADHLKILGFKPEVDIAHRLKTDPKKKLTPAIIVRFKDRSTRNLFYQNRFSLKDITITNLGFKDENVKGTKIFINESLSVATKTLFKSARAKAKELKYHSCNTSQGIIYAKKIHPGPRITITRETDLLKIC